MSKRFIYSEGVMWDTHSTLNNPDLTIKDGDLYLLDRKIGKVEYEFDLEDLAKIKSFDEIQAENQKLHKKLFDLKNRWIDADSKVGIYENITIPKYQAKAEAFDLLKEHIMLNEDYWTEEIRIDISNKIIDKDEDIMIIKKVIEVLKNE